MATQQPASFKQTLIMYYAFFAGQAIMGLLIFFFMKEQAPMSPESPYNIIIPGAVVLGIAASYLIGMQLNSSLPVNGSLQEKLDHYRRTSIVRFALVEGGNLISLVLTFMMANTNYLMWFGIGLAAFVLLRPAKDRFREDYEIKAGERVE